MLFDVALELPVPINSAIRPHQATDTLAENRYASNVLNNNNNVQLSTINTVKVGYVLNGRHGWSVGRSQAACIVRLVTRLSIDAAVN